MRQSEFKTGIGSGQIVTQKHREKNESLRKDKRQTAMARIRGITLINPNASFPDMLKRYMKEPTIEKLFYLLQQASEAEIITNANNMLQGGKVLHLLVRAMAGSDQKNGVQAMDCLIFITGVHIAGDEVEYAKLLSHPGTFATIAAHIEEDTVLALGMWSLANNLMDIGVQSKVAVLASPLFSGGSNALIFKELRRKRPNFQSTIIRTIMTTFQADKYHLPPREYIYNMWPFIMDFFYTIAPIAKRSYSDEDDSRIHYLCILLEAFKAKSQQEDDVVFFGQLALHNIPFITYLLQLIPRTGMVNQQRLSFFLVKVSLLETPPLMQAMRSAGGLAIMTTLTQMPNVKVQENGILWIANFCSDSIEHVQETLQKGVFFTIGRLLTAGHKYDLIKPIVWLFKASCSVCVDALPAANSFLERIVKEANVVQSTVSAITKVAEVTLLCDILDLWKDLVRWNPEEILNQLEMFGAEQKLSLLLQHKNSDVFDKAEALLCLMEKNDDGDVEMSDIKVFSF